MRTRTNSIVAAFVLLSLVSGAIGCRSNGGPWYNPKSYAWHNPFKASEAPAFDAEGTAQANQKPSIGAQPNVNTPPGGYTNHQEEARFLAGNGKKDTVMVPQYGVTPGTTDNSRIASTTGTPAPQSAYPETPYNPYAAMDNTTTAGMTPQPGIYQGTNLHTASVPPSTQTGAYPGTGVQSAGTFDPMTYPGTAPAAAPTTVQAGGYSPYGAPVTTPQNAAPIYGDSTATNPYAQPVTQTGYTAQPSAPQSYAAPQYDAQPTQQQGFGAPVGTAAPVNPYPGYTAAPSSYPTVPQGF